jgi:nitronate monooxygenase
LRVELPIVPAGMGGGLAGHELAAAVSAGGGLGTIGILPPDDLREQIAAARRITDRPLAVNLLPFARGAHFQAASAADMIVTFWGRPQRCTPGLDPPVWLRRRGDCCAGGRRRPGDRPG